MKRYDAVVVGAGPNGLAAAITVARAGRSVLVLEGAEAIGGGTRSAELTLPGYIHDVCAAVHPLAASSPLFRRLPLQEHGLEWVQPTLPLAHPFADGSALALHRSIADTTAQFPEDAAAYRRLIEPLAANWGELADEILRPVLHIPRHPLLLARFGLPALLSAAMLSNRAFTSPQLRALFAGTVGHAILPLEQWLSASFGLVLVGAAHGAGWPIVRGGSQRLADALASYLRSLGGEIETSRPVRTMDDIPSCRAVLFDVAPERLADIAGDHLGGRYRARMRDYRRGEAVFKLDYALSEPVPWTAAECREAGTVHLGGTVEEMSIYEDAVAHGRIGDAPLVLVGQQSLFDASRAPAGKHTLWAYCHVPNNSSVDMTDAVERQIERFAPGFRDVVLARATIPADEAEAHNPNLVGGDISGGSNAGLNLFLRPGPSLHPYRTPGEGIYLCSASTPPAGGIHGMCGYWAARDALGRELR